MKAGRILLPLALLALGLGAGVGYGKYELGKARDLYEAEIRECEGKGDLLKKKYTEQKALVGQLMRAKAQLEGRQRALQNEMDKLQEEMESQEGASGALRAAIKEKDAVIIGLRSEIQGLEMDLEKGREQMERLATLHKKEIEKKDDAIAGLEDKNYDLTDKLERSKSAHNKCIEHNARLCTIAGELIEKYKNKGVGDAIAQKEPFTQVKKIELEKLIQEYTDRIEDEKVDPRS